MICYAALGAVLQEVPGYVEHQLGGSALDVGLAVGAPALTGALLRPLGGRAADRLGPARILMAGAAVMAVGVLPAFERSLPALLASRLLVGAGEALMMSSTVLWLLTLAGTGRRGAALGHIGLANYAGLAVGPLAAEGLARHGGIDRLWVAVMLLPALAIALTALLPRPARLVQADPGRSASGRSRVGRLILRPGVGLLLVNLGYVAVISFGAAAADAHRLQISALIVPLFGIGVIASRTLLVSVPDRLGGPRTLLAASVAEGCGLVMFGMASNMAVAVGGLVVLSIGQGLAVPALGLIALAPVPPERQGAAAGSFFAFFDAGVGLGGPAVGAVAGAFDPGVALVLAGAAVVAAGPVVLLRASSVRASRLPVGSSVQTVRSAGAEVGPS